MDEEVKETSDDQASNRRGVTSRPHTISRATRHKIRRGLEELDTEGGHARGGRSRSHSARRRRDENDKGGARQGKFRRQRDRSDDRGEGSGERRRRRHGRSHSQGEGDDRSPHRHRHHGRRRHHRRRRDVGPNTHVIQGGELEAQLLRRLTRWGARGGGNGSDIGCSASEDDTRL